jgi:hypothetical protein
MANLLSNNNNASSIAQNREEIPFGVKWDWDDAKKCLTYKKYEIKLFE